MPQSLAIIVDHLKTLVDHLKAMAVASEIQKRTVFEQLVGPLFESFKIVSKEYIDMFAGIRDRINRSSGGNLHELAKRLDDERRANLADRREIMAIAFHLATEINDTEISRFAAYIVDFFDGSNDASDSLRNLSELRDTPAKTPSVALVEKVISTMLSGGDHKSLQEEIESLIMFFERKTQQITYCYGSVRVHSIAPLGALRRPWWAFWK
jgi:hypothetical protein